jgi:uncharacterized protein (TIGR00251 family)
VCDSGQRSLANEKCFSSGTRYVRWEMIPIEDTSDGATFAIKVHSHARKNAIIGELGDALKLSITASASDGRANRACIEFLANLLKVPRSSVTIASGQTSRRKVIRVAGLAAEEVRKVLSQ